MIIRVGITWTTISRVMGGDNMDDHIPGDGWG